MRRVFHGSFLFILMTTFLLILAACGSSEDSSTKEDQGTTEQKDDQKDDQSGNDQVVYSPDDFSKIKTNQGEPIEGGTFTLGLVSDTVFPGTLNWAFQEAAIDSAILYWFYDEMLDWDENFFFTQDGAATYEVSDDGKVFTFTIRDNVNWHDGEPVTAEDWAFMHEVRAHPDHPGGLSATLRLVEGIEAYNKGEVDHISGIEIIDDKTLQITYTEASPALLTGGILNTAMPKHIFGDMEVSEMAESPEVRQHPIGFGPFKVESIVPGESVTFSKYEDYWRGEPHLDEVILKVVDPKVVVNELRTGGVDTVNSFPANQFPDNADMSNVEFLGDISWGYSYLGFKLGTWDRDNGEVKPDPDAKMADVNLRRAMWHAIDTQAVGERFFHGLRWRAGALIPPSHPEFHDETQPGLEFDPDKANQILDEAGYEWPDGEEFRKDPDGNDLTIIFAAQTGDDTAEPIANYYRQAWKEVGLNVQLLDDRLHEFNTHYENIGDTGNDNPEVDVFLGGWRIGKNVDPSRYYGRDVLFNYSRYASEENDRLLEAGNSAEANDVEYRKQVYKDWQQLMVDDVPVIPLQNYLDIVPVNNRVLDYSIGHGTGMYRHEIKVTQEEPIVAE